MQISSISTTSTVGATYAFFSILILICPKLFIIANHAITHIGFLAVNNVDSRLYYLNNTLPIKIINDITIITHDLIKSSCVLSFAIETESESCSPSDTRRFVLIVNLIGCDLKVCTLIGISNIGLISICL